MTATGTSQQVYGRNYGGSAPENYERYFVPAIGGPLAADLVDAAALRPGERVLDVACGTGVVTRRAAKRVGAGGTVAGLDVNAAMLEVARPLAAGVPIRWYEASAEAMPLPDETFDVVLCQLGLQFVPDKGAALREMRRVLVPGGRLLASVPGPSEFFDVMDEAIARRIDPETAAFVRLVFSLYDTARLEELVRGAGFRDVVVRTHAKSLRLPAPADFLWQYVRCTPLAAAVEQVDDERRAALERDVVAGWRPWTEGGGMTYQQDVAVATGRR
jgi:ubiquinone/menaquinone biosynthesis C-methylase UbiE